MSNWEDTVISEEVINTFLQMTQEELIKTSGYPALYNEQEFVTFSKTILLSMLQAQAETTGSTASKAGIEEVVEWVNNNIAFANIGLSYREWRTKLKEWGIDEK